MANIYHGRGACVGFGIETTWGNAAARTNWRPLISSNLLRTVEKVPRPTLRVGSAGAMRRSHFVQNETAGGTFSIEGSYGSLGMLLQALMGADTTTGTGPWTHTYTFADDVPEGLTIENNRGTGTSEVFEGCRLNSGTFSVSAGGVMTCEFDVLAETAATRGTLGTPTFAADTPILHHHAGQMSFNGSNYDVIDMSLTVNNALATRQFLGTKLTAKQLRSDFQSVEFTATIEVEDTLYNEYLSDAESDLQLSFTDGTNTFTIDVHNAYISASSDPVSDANVIRQSLTFMGQSDGTDEGCKLTVINQNSGPTDN